MVKSRFIILLLIFISSSVFAESDWCKYIVYFKDKDYSLNIESVFSNKALEKRRHFNILFDQRDYPVNPRYLSALQKEQVVLKQSSSWLNAVMIEAQANQAAQIAAWPFIASITKLKEVSSLGISAVQQADICDEALTFEDSYTSSFPQFNLLKGEYMHEQGYNGENMTIAVCDGGFTGANTNVCFDHIRSEGRLLGTYDYVNNDSTVYESISHGTNVLSCIAGVINNDYIGTARKARFYLFMTENADTERLQEEFNLATALERCAQLGVDVVNISLGYTTFDLPSENHDTSDMMKNNTPSAKAVNIASSKGILVVVAAGNEGSGTWHYISSPSDADSAFAIAAVDVNGNPAPFSGYGLANDPRVKPNVAAVGWNMKVISSNNSIAVSSGTSFAAPSLAGMAACLWQAYPGKTNWQIKTAIEQSASQFLTPDKHIGYGIPDFQKAYQLLSSPTYVSNASLENELVVYPNPFKSAITVRNLGATSISDIRLTNSIGQVVYNTFNPADGQLVLNDLPKGIYLMQITTNQGLLIKKLMKD